MISSHLYTLEYHTIDPEYPAHYYKIPALQSKHSGWQIDSVRPPLNHPQISTAAA